MVWKRLDKGIKKTLDLRRRKYNEDQKKRLEEIGKTSQWYNIAKFLNMEETPARWNVTDLKPDQEPKQLAHELASHFPLITNASAALIPGNIPTSTNTGSNFTRLVTSKQVENHTKGFKIPNSRVEGDIPKHLIKPLAKHLAIPLSEIYNESFVNESWPLVWKVETVIPIPKTLSPGVSMISAPYQ